VSLSSATFFALRDFLLRGRGCRPPTNRDIFTTALSPSARRPDAIVGYNISPHPAISSSPLHSSSLLSHQIRISGHILCSFSQVSHPSQHHASPPGILIVGTCRTSSNASTALESLPVPHIAKVFDIYDPVSPPSPSHLPFTSLTPPHLVSSCPTLLYEACSPSSLISHRSSINEQIFLPASWLAHDDKS
jgi:hypothetical protein